MRRIGAFRGEILEAIVCSLHLFLATFSLYVCVCVFVFVFVFVYIYIYVCVCTCMFVWHNISCYISPCLIPTPHPLPIMIFYLLAYGKGSHLCTHPQDGVSWPCSIRAAERSATAPCLLQQRCCWCCGLACPGLSPCASRALW